MRKWAACSPFRCPLIFWERGEAPLPTGRAQAQGRWQGRSSGQMPPSNCVTLDAFPSLPEPPCSHLYVVLICSRILLGHKKEWNTITFCIHAYMAWLLFIMLLGTLGYIYLFNLEFLSVPNICPGMRLLDHIVALFLDCEGIFVQFSIVAVLVHIPPTV